MALFLALLIVNYFKKSLQRALFGVQTLTPTLKTCIRTNKSIFVVGLIISLEIKDHEFIFQVLFHKSWEQQSQMRMSWMSSLYFNMHNWWIIVEIVILNWMLHQPICINSSSSTDIWDKDDIVRTSILWWQAAQKLRTSIAWSSFKHCKKFSQTLHRRCMKCLLRWYLSAYCLACLTGLL